jgi:uncharacterized protein YcfJ
MKQTLIVVALGLAAGAAMAQDSGRVISSTPVIQQVAVPYQNCAPAQMVQAPSSGGGALIGAVVGGLLGNTIGHGMGRAAATGVGVMAGAAVGGNVANAQGQYATQCATQTSYENRTVGYNVTYEYGGRQYTVQMPYDPGPTVPVQVTPVGANGGPAVQPMYNAPVATSSLPTVISQPVTVMPAPVAYYPGYYPGYYQPYAPGVSLSFGYVGGGWGHHHRGHWR